MMEKELILRELEVIKNTIEELYISGDIDKLVDKIKHIKKEIEQLKEKHENDKKNIKKIIKYFEHEIKEIEDFENEILEQIYEWDWRIHLDEYLRYIDCLPIEALKDIYNEIKNKDIKDIAIFEIIIGNKNQGYFILFHIDDKYVGYTKETKTKHILEYEVNDPVYGPSGVYSTKYYTVYKKLEIPDKEISKYRNTYVFKLKSIIKIDANISRLIKKYINAMIRRKEVEYMKHDLEYIEYPFDKIIKQLDNLKEEITKCEDNVNEQINECKKETIDNIEELEKYIELDSDDIINKLIEIAKTNNTKELEKMVLMLDYRIHDYLNKLPADIEDKIRRMMIDFYIE